MRTTTRALAHLHCSSGVEVDCDFISFRRRRATRRVFDWLSKPGPFCVRRAARLFTIYEITNLMKYEMHLNARGDPKKSTGLMWCLDKGLMRAWDEKKIELKMRPAEDATQTSLNSKFWNRPWFLNRFCLWERKLMRYNLATRIYI